VFDQRALQRWGFEESTLPQVSMVLNQQPTIWESYGPYVLGAVVCLAQALLILGLLWQRARKREIEKSLSERLALETLLSDLSGTFVESPEEQVNWNIEKSFGRIAEFLKLDRITLFETSQAGELRATSSWGSDGTEPVLLNSKPIPWPWWTGQGLGGEPVTFSNAHVLPEETSQIRRYLLESGIESIASVPLRVGDEIVGALSFVSTKRRVLWTEDLVRQLKVVAEILSNALKRKRAMYALLVSNSELKRSECVLRESEERLRMAIQAGRMYAFEWNLATDEVVRTGECAGIFTWLKDPWRDTGKQFRARMHPDDRASYSFLAAASTPENPAYQASYRLIRPDGSIVWQEESGRAFFDERARIIRETGIVADVTARKMAEEALRQRELELVEAQRLAQVGSWHWDARNDAVIWSKELYRIAGRDPNRVPPAFGEHAQLYTPESWERLKRAVGETLRTGAPYELDLQMVRPDGSTRWITDRGETLRDTAGQIVALRGTAQDITERKHVENWLRTSEEKFRSVFQNAEVGMVIVSPKGRFLAANEAFCECLGYTEEELLQKTVQSITLPEDWPSFSQRLREAVERGTSLQRVEECWLHKSGRIVATECSASLIRGPSGEPQYFVGEVLDVTQRKLAEEALSSLSRRLIEAHEEERTWIARELHDDFGQRIALLAVNLEKVKQELPTSAVEVGQRIEEVSRCVSDLGSEIQALSHRLHSSKLEYLGLVAASRAFCSELSHRQNVEIDFRSQDIPKNLPQEIALCLFRVLQEALQNAIKHSGARRFEVSLQGVANEIQLSVHDSGVGFDPDKAIAGHGLGLISMRERLKLVDGQLFVYSEPHDGTTIDARVLLRPLVKTAGSAG
jgi:PAS domain S-box-containing protein